MTNATLDLFRLDGKVALVTGAGERRGKASVKHMLGRGGGSVVNIALVTGIETKRATLSYGTAKAALTHMTRLMAADWSSAHPCDATVAFCGAGRQGP